MANVEEDRLNEWRVRKIDGERSRNNKRDREIREIGEKERALRKKQE